MTQNNIVEIKYEQTGNSSNTNELGMREMQAKVYKARDEQLFSEKKVVILTIKGI